MTHVSQVPGVFISYRRDDSAGHVGRLYDALTARFGQSAVFMDIDHIKPGENFVDVLQRSIAACRVLLVVIGTQWLQRAHDGGPAGIDESQDFVRAEIAAGLTRDMLVIPVLVHGAAMPQAADFRPICSRSSSARRSGSTISAGATTWIIFSSCSPRTSRHNSHHGAFH